ncbi:hypothetical protein HA402_015882 [Bradysia odoriphaga]|nr:hypothetical protein HA402_015882 [Bradysia odoriphaga]
MMDDIGQVMMEANDGKYRPSDDGKYTHIGDKDRGQYTGGGGEYTGGGGEYTGGGGAYDGGFGKYSGGSGQSNAGANAGIGSRVGLEKYSTTLKPTPNVNAIGNNGWRIIRDERTEDTDGYHYLYETENGILAEESGRIENLAPNEDGLRSKGFYQYTGDDGVLYRVDYVADNNGFVPQGDHLPKTPPAVQKLLDYLASQS